METYCFFLVFLISVTHMYITLGCSSTKNIENRNIQLNTICATDECRNAASEILAKLNQTADPCDNFYKFACGGWIKNHPVNVSFSYVGSYTDIERRTENQLRELLQEAVKKSDTLSILKAKHIFAQCMEYFENDTIEVSDYSAIWKEYTDWPWNTISRTWEEEFSQEFRDWQSFSDDLHEHGFNNGLFDIQVKEDIKMTNTNVIVIETPSLVLPTSNMSQHTTISPLIEMFRDLNPYIGSRDHIIRIASEIETFAKDLDTLKQVSQNSEYFEQDEYFTLPIIEWDGLYDNIRPKSKNAEIDWQSTIQKLFATQGVAIKSYERLHIKESTSNYIHNLISLLDKTPSRTIINYMKSTVFYQLWQYTKPETDFFARGMTWKRCLNNTNFKSAISHEYVKKYASHLNITAIREIGSDVKLAFAENIRHSTWMDEQTRQGFLEKLAYMKLEFIKPDWYSDEAIDRYYKDLNVNMGYLENILNIYIFERKMMLKSLRTHVPKARWFAEPTEVMYYFNFIHNTLGVNAAYLHTPTYYNINRLQSINYGSLGFIIAHIIEIGHSFDVKNGKYDKDGNMVQWWTERSSAAFNNLKQCFVEQYDNYLLPGFEDNNTHVDGLWTLLENIADSVGIASAFYAYKSRKARLNEKEWRLHGLEKYSTDQIFFILYAQTLCANYHPADLENILHNDRAVSEIRVRGSLSNSRDFSKVYNCSVGKPMNPEKKCTLKQ